MKDEDLNAFNIKEYDTFIFFDDIKSALPDKSATYIEKVANDLNSVWIQDRLETFLDLVDARSEELGITFFETRGRSDGWLVVNKDANTNEILALIKDYKKALPEFKKDFLEVNLTDLIGS